jgi:hypothetical protein
MMIIFLNVLWNLRSTNSTSIANQTLVAVVYSALDECDSDLSAFIGTDAFCNLIFLECRFKKPCYVSLIRVSSLLSLLWKLQKPSLVLCSTPSKVSFLLRLRAVEMS